VANRVYYAVSAVGVTSNLDATALTTIHGVQSCGVTTNFDVNYITELGQIDTYASMENRPDVSVTMEKVLDGWPLIYHLATADSTTVTLGSRTANPCKLGLAVFDDELVTSASGTPTATLIVSSAYIDSVDYNLVIDGDFTESVTFMANDRRWSTDDWFAYDFDNSDTPQNAYDGILRRQNVLMGESSVWPGDIFGLDANGYNQLQSGSDKYSVHFQSVTISCSLGRGDIYELGRKSAYYRPANYPVEVTCSIEAVMESGDMKDVFADERNLENQEINLVIADDSGNNRVRLDLGTKNKLTSIDWTGGDSGGGERTTTFNYSNYNKLDIRSDSDPAGLGLG